MNMFMSMESCQTQTHIHIYSQLTNDNSNEEALDVGKYASKANRQPVDG